MKAIRGITRAAGFTVLMVIVGRALWWATRTPVSEVAHAVHGGSQPAGWSFDRLLVDAASCLAVLIFAALAVSATLTVVAALLGDLLPGVRRAGAALTPALWRRCVVAACGLGIATPALLTVSASADDGGHSARCINACAIHLGGLPLPDLPSAALPKVAKSASAGHQPPRSPGTTGVVVAPGDSLWSIAARRLPPEAPDWAVAAMANDLYSLNRHVIGPNPDLIFPGTHLTTPEGSS
ncbi:MAG: LysM peptidoglycan-binding domain-containing protein [Nocardioidaceae bacterium]